MRYWRTVTPTRLCLSFSPLFSEKQFKLFFRHSESCQLPETCFVEEAVSIKINQSFIRGIVQLDKVKRCRTIRSLGSGHYRSGSGSGQSSTTAKFLFL